MSRLLRFSAVTILFACLFLPATPARASLRAGCVGSDDIGVPGVVGWTDAGLLFQVDPAEAPKLMIVIGPDGTEQRFVVGVGLQPATTELPFWLLPVAVDGAYTLIVDGYDCTVEATGSSTEQTDAVSTSHRTSLPVLQIEDLWRATSAPVRNK